MTVKDLYLSIMDMLDITDESKIRKALNRVIGKINSKIPGISIKQGIVTLPNTMILSGATWDNAGKILTFPKSLKRLNKVTVKNSTSEYDFYSKDQETVRLNPTSNYFFPRGSFQIEFATDNELIETTGAFIYVEAFFVIEKVDVQGDTSTGQTLDVPDDWEAGILAGIICELTLSGKYKDEFVYKEYRGIFWGLLEDLETWEDTRIPIEQSERAYNYHDPSKKFK